ncbi:MAG: phosphotransferase [Alphaproteobacteria bacterium]|nr:phosphotransferase [Alphaproteobacteria bacterium]MCB9691253.1 phosphotransferase [Alphaproteobacteria bacterium]
MSATLPAIRRIATRALARFSPDAQVGRLYNHGENTVYRVEGRPWVLRVHRRDYHAPAGIVSELAAMAAASRAGLLVGEPVSTTDGEPLVEVDGRVVTVVGRLEGRRAPGIGRGRAEALGRTLAALHTWSRGWTPPAGFERPRWDRAGLYGPRALWGDLEGAGVDPGFAAELRSGLDEALLPLEAEVIFLHHDLHAGNLIWTGTSPGLIDWDDSGFGFPLADVVIATRRLDPAVRARVIAAYGGLPAGWEAVFPVVGLALLARSVAWLQSRRDVPRIAAHLPAFREKLVTSGRSWLAGKTSSTPEKVREASAAVSGVASSETVPSR